MATKLTEFNIEDLGIELIETHGYQEIDSSDISPRSETPEGAFFGDIILQERLRTAIVCINPTIPLSTQEDVVREYLAANEYLISENITICKSYALGLHNKGIHAKDYELGDVI